MDEVAWLHNMIEKVGLADNAMPGAINLANEILQRCTGDDIPANIGDKQEPLPEPDPRELLLQRAADVAEVTNLVIAKLKGKRIPK